LIHAVVLVGGQGLRLRPLTEKTPKPMLSFFDRPLLAWVLDPLLASTSLGTVTLATGFASRAFARWSRTLAPRVLTRREPDPRGTGGALGWVLSRRGQPCSSPLWVQNGDALIWPPVDTLVDAHRRSGADATLGVLWHPTPQRFGRLDVTPAGALAAFREKDASRPEPGWINAGIYLLESVLWKELDAGPSSLERDWFPRWLAAGRKLQTFPIESYFCDLGTPESFRQAHFDVLAGRTPLELGTGGVWVGEGVELAPECRLEGPVVLGAGCRLAKGAAVRESILGPNVRLGAYAQVERCLLGEGARVQAGVKLRNEVRSA
jgi:mannose-1-phosphate guanylyltransferase